MASSPPPLWVPTPDDVSFVLGLVRRRIPRHPQVHEDLTQEALLHASRSLATSPVEPRRLLRGIVRNVVNDWLRDQKSVPEAAEEDVDCLEDLTTPGADERLRAAQRTDVLVEGLRAVPPLYRDIVVRHELEGEPMARIAQSHGVGVCTAYDRFRRGRLALAAALRRILARRRIDKEDLTVPVPFFADTEEADAPDGEPTWTSREPAALQWPACSAAGLLAAAALTGLLLAHLREPAGIAAVAEPPAMNASVSAAESIQPGTAGMAAPAHATAQPPPLPPSAEPDAGPGAGALSSPRSHDEAPAARRETGPAPGPSNDEAAWARRIRALARRGRTREAAIEASSFRGVYPGSTLLLEHR